MEVDAARCAVVGPSGMGGFERRSTHSVLILLSIVKRLSIRAEHFFQSDLAKCLRRCRAQEARV